MRGLFAVMEDELNASMAAPTNEQVERVQELEEQVAQAEVAEGQAEVSEMADTADEAVTAIEELADVAEVMSDSVEGEGEGLTEDAAEIAEVAVEAICARLGYKPAKKPMPSMEAFGSTSSRVEATKYALEGLGDTMRKIWEAIKGFFSRIWEAIKGLWNRLFDASTKVGDRVKKLEEKLKAAKDDGLVADTKKKYDAVKFCKAFNVKDAAAVAEGAVAILGAHTTMTKEQSKINDSLAGLFEKAEKAETSEQIKAILDGVANNKTFRKGTFAFNTTVNAEVDVEKGSFKFDLVSNDPKIEKAEGKVVSLDDVEAVIGAAKEFQAELPKAKANLSKAESAVKKGIAAADKMSKDEKVDASVAKLRAAGFKAGQTALITVNTKLPTLGLKAASAALDFAAINLAGYKDEEKKAS